MDLGLLQQLLSIADLEEAARKKTQNQTVAPVLTQDNASEALLTSQPVIQSFVSHHEKSSYVLTTEAPAPPLNTTRSNVNVSSSSCNQTTTPDPTVESVPLLSQESSNETVLISVIVFLSAVIVVAAVVLAVRHFNSWGVYRTHEDKAPFNLNFRYDPGTHPAPEQSGVIFRDKRQLIHGGGGGDGVSGETGGVGLRRDRRSPNPPVGPLPPRVWSSDDTIRAAGGDLNSDSKDNIPSPVLYAGSHGFLSFNDVYNNSSASWD